MHYTNKKNYENLLRFNFDFDVSCSIHYTTTSYIFMFFHIYMSVCFFDVVITLYFYRLKINEFILYFFNACRSLHQRKFQLKKGLSTLIRIPCHHVSSNETNLNLKYRIGLKQFFNINLGIGIIKKIFFLFAFSTYMSVFLLKFRIQRVPTWHTFDGPRYPKNKKIK